MASTSLIIRIVDIEPMRLFIWELRMLADQMRVEANPAAERLEHALDRFTAPLEDKEPE
jgi:hypothetical protein